MIKGPPKLPINKLSLTARNLIGWLARNPANSGYIKNS